MMFGKPLSCATAAREPLPLRIAMIKTHRCFDLTNLVRVRGQAHRSVRGKALSAELFARLFNPLPARRLNAVERIAEFKFFPLESAHLMEGENIHSFYIAETGGE